MGQAHVSRKNMCVSARHLGVKKKDYQKYISSTHENCGVVQICAVSSGRGGVHDDSSRAAPPQQPPPPQQQQQQPPLQCSSRAPFYRCHDSLLHLFRPFTVLRIPVILCNRRISLPLHSRAPGALVSISRLLWPFPYFCPPTTLIFLSGSLLSLRSPSHLVTFTSRNREEVEKGAFCLTPTRPRPL
jgi:hypothetical protein